jgi:hypothetical protein
MCQWNIKFRGQGITQKKEYNINKHGKVGNQEKFTSYGEETARNDQLLEKLWIKKTTLLTSLLHCGDHNTIACVLQFHYFTHSRTASRIINAPVVPYCRKGYIITDENLTTFLENC